MCNLSDAIEQQGRYDAQASMVEQVMEMMNWSLEEALAKFKFSDIERNAIRRRLQPES